MRVFVKNLRGQPLMPCKPQKARKLLKTGKAVVVKRSPFTIQLTTATGETVQDITLGVDAGYAHVGFSAVTDKAELVGGEFTLLKGMPERLTARAMYRRNRRNRLRFRKPGFLKDTKDNGWLAPSVQHKLDSHVRLVNQLKSILPISKVILEVAAFDIQKIRNPEIEGFGYQNGPQTDYRNVREYVFHRDGHKCQNPNCKNRDKQPILQAHHIGFWRQDRTSRPENLLTLCTKCHTSENHQPSGFLFGWQPKLKRYREATFMSMVRWRMVGILCCYHTYGYQTKSKRITLELHKSHLNDAFVIANGTHQSRTVPYAVSQRRRNNRSLERFRDAKYIDLRDGSKKSGKELCSPRRKRTRENLPENLRHFRAHKVSKGRRAIRRQRYYFQPGDIVRLDNTILTTKGTMSNGNSVLLTNGKTKTPRGLELITFGKGLQFTVVATC